MATETILKGDHAEKRMGSAGSIVKEGIISSIAGIRNVQLEIANMARTTVSSTLQAADSLAGASRAVTLDVIKGAIAATEVMGIGLATTFKIVAKGIIMGVGGG